MRTSGVSPYLVVETVSQHRYDISTGLRRDSLLCGLAARELDSTLEDDDECIRDNYVRPLAWASSLYNNLAYDLNAPKEVYENIKALRKNTGKLIGLVQRKRQEISNVLRKHERREQLSVEQELLLESLSNGPSEIRKYMDAIPESVQRYAPDVRRAA